MPDSPFNVQVATLIEDENEENEDNDNDNDNEDENNEGVQIIKYGEKSNKKNKGNHGVEGLYIDDDDNDSDEEDSFSNSSNNLSQKITDSQKNSEKEKNSDKNSDENSEKNKNILYDNFQLDVQDDNIAITWVNGFHNGGAVVEYEVFCSQIRDYDFTDLVEAKKEIKLGENSGDNNVGGSGVLCVVEGSVGGGDGESGGEGNEKKDDEEEDTNTFFKAKVNTIETIKDTHESKTETEESEENKMVTVLDSSPKTEIKIENSISCPTDGTILAIDNLESDPSSLPWENLTTTGMKCSSISFILNFIFILAFTYAFIFIKFRCFFC